MKAFFTYFVLLFSIQIGYAQTESSDPVNIVVQTDDDLTVYTFDNLKSIDSNKLDRFVTRLVNNYEKVVDIRFKPSENQFEIHFNTPKIDTEELKDILSHFDVYHFSFSKK